MKKEIKINLIGSKIEKPLAVKKRASRCIQGKCKITSLGDNLSKQMFDDAPALCEGNGLSDKDTYVYVKKK